MDTMPALRRMSRSKKFAIILCLASLLCLLTWQLHMSQIRGHIDAGTEFANNQQYDRAEEEWRAVVSADPQNESGWRLLASLYLSEHNWQSAIEAFGNVRRIAPDAPDINACLATSNLYAGNQQAALSFAREELKHHPDDITSLNIATDALDRMGLQQEELVYLRRLAGLLPNETKYQERLGEALYRVYQYDEARSLLDSSIQKAPRNYKLWRLRGLCRFESDPTPSGLDAAKADLDQALRLNPADANSHYYLGRIYLRRLQLTRAITELEQTTRLGPSISKFWFELSNAYRRAGQTQQARAAQMRFESLQTAADDENALAKRCAFEPNNYEIQLDEGLLLMQMGNFRKAAVYLHRAGSLRPNDARTLAALRKYDSWAAGEEHNGETQLRQ